MDSSFDRDHTIRQITDRLQERFPDQPLGTIEEVVTRQVDALADQPIKDYVSALAEREAKRQLAQR